MVIFHKVIKIRGIKMKRNKLVAFMLSLYLTVGLISSLVANAEFKPRNNKVKVESKASTYSSITINVNVEDLVTELINGDNLIEIKGVKSKVAVMVVKALISRTSWFCNTIEYLGIVDDKI